MAKNLMICEPNTNLPQKIVLEPKSFSANQNNDPQSGDSNKFQLEVQSEYNVLPLFHRPNEHFKYFLSVDKNPYLRCKWYNFLENLPSHYITVKLYRDVIAKKELKRKMSLNGKFYGVDNKLAPIPLMSDPRQNNLKPLQIPHEKCPN